MLVIPAIQASEIRKIKVSGQARQKVCKAPSQPEKLGMLVRNCHPRDCRKLKIGGSWYNQLRQKGRLYLQNNQSKKGWRCGSSNRAPAS
jgi:hypothetical protein